MNFCILLTHHRPEHSKFQLLVVFLLVFSVLISCSSSNQELSERTISFNDGWKFYRGDIAGAEDVSFDDHNWRVLDVPHDWSIEDLPENEYPEQIGPFTPDSPGGTSTGFVIGGIGWYRKPFVLDKSTRNKKVQIYFDGVYMNSEVWINGHYLGIQPYGYTPFYYDLTPYLFAPGKTNVLAVKVNNNGRNSRWYSGSGIYRNVDLIITGLLHIKEWGQFITSPEVSAARAKVNVSSTVINETTNDEQVALLIHILDISNNLVAQTSSEIALPAGSEINLDNMVELSQPDLWSVESPNLYKAVSKIVKNGQVIDEKKQTFGIRSIEFSAENGFLLNGEPVLLKGGCLHHDNGPLGAAAINRAEERRVELMKQFGFNALRTAHNPPSKALLEACDRLGMLVIDEAFDQWQRPKNPDDYHLYFDDWHTRDLEAMVLRDRNHPSVIIWSIGNEISERADPSGIEITRRLGEIVRALDHTRPVNAGLCGFWEQENRGKEWEITAAAFELLEVAGYNYQLDKYESDHAMFPDRIIIGTESFASEALENWRMAEKYPWVLGDFVWTSMDYMGEAGIGHSVTAIDPVIKPSPGWPWYNAFCGDIDICGFKKPQSYYRDVVWRNSNLEMAVHRPVPPGMSEAVSRWGWPDELQSWNWEGYEGVLLDVNVYSNYPQVKLEMNGKVIGIQNVLEENRLTASFKVPYEAGELKATALQNGVEKETKVLVTTGKPSKIMLLPDYETIPSGRNNLVFVTVSIVDEEGNWVPDTTFPVQFETTGQGELAAVENGKPDDVKSFKAYSVYSYNGKCLAVLRPVGIPGEIKLKAASPGLEGAELIVKILDQ
jgi:beta-galactosidase